MRRSMLVTALVAAAFALPVSAQQNLDLPRSYALTNVRIVVAPGQVIENGTVLFRDGRIVAASADVQVPSDVPRIDSSGRTVYPGLVDAATNIGIAAAVGGGRGGGGRGGRGAALPLPEATGPTEDPGPTREAANLFSPAPEDLEALRSAGVTTAAVGFTDGIFMGRVSAVSTRNGEPMQLVLRTPVASQVAFGRGRGEYPSTLMGAIAYIRQALYDAQWEVQATAAFERDPATAPRPTYDPEAIGLLPVINGDLPLWMHAESERDIGRMIDIANEFDLDSYVVVGAQEGFRATSALADAGRPVIVSLAFPNAGSVTGRIFELHVPPLEGDDPEGEALDSAAARSVRGNAATLAGAGISIALSSWGLPTPADYRARLLDAVEAGLSAEDALRATTVVPAQLLGLERAIGTIEPGKFANLVVTEGDLFSRSGRIREVFVEGERYVIPQTATAGAAGRAGGRGGGRGGARGGGAGAGALAVAGPWRGVFEGPTNTMQFEMTLMGTPDAVRGQIESEMTTIPLTGTFADGRLALSGTYGAPGMNPIDIDIDVQLTNGILDGTITFAGRAPVPFQARPGNPRATGIAPQGGNR